MNFQKFQHTLNLFGKILLLCVVENFSFAMAPNTTLLSTPADVVFQNTKTPKIDTSYRTLWGYFKTPLKLPNIMGISIGNFLTVVYFVTFPYSSFHHMKTMCWAFLMGWAAGLGVTAGAHRLWAHKSYKAKLPMKIVLGIFYGIAGQTSIYDWVRDHRLHHKFSETDADPHNINRGFFFAHVGWIMMKRHPEVLKHGRQIDCSDLFEDPFVVFYQKFFSPIKLFFCVIFPMMVPYYCWNETLYWCVMSCIARYFTSLNCTWLVNSAAHMFGNKPYNKAINPTENRMVAFCAMGEGWHNYHHTFPWDYKAAELGNYRGNVTTLFIDLFAKLGLAYDLKTPSKKLVQKAILMKGDGSHKVFN